jgi:serine/threonine protein kinase/WD40 repeat protein
MSDASPGSGRDPVERLLESFLARWRRRERPSLDDYAARCPERAGEIRELFPAVIEMEQLKPDVAAGTSSPEQPTTRPESPARPEPPHPERLGDYRILRVIGEGGMGVVFEAEHESLKSRVALKVMHRRFRTDRSYLRRFHTEARSAARLHHTNIVTVFDFGEQDGICYYAMQYIAGVGLDRVLDDVRRLRAEGARAPPSANGAAARATEAMTGPISAVSRGLLTGRFAAAPTPPGPEPPTTHALEDGPAQSLGDQVPDERPSAPPPDGEASSGNSLLSGESELVYFREVARLGAQVADALDYAHRQKVVHRDIKPSNLLLDAQGNVWVTDFGLAKLIEGEDLSHSHDLAGTLRFMAPERLRGVTDRRSDIYALGATLYEMLALRPVFAERDQVRLIEQIAHRAPTPLRQHDLRIPRDLETIVHKALAKDPDDRCDRVIELRDELRRFLEGRPTRWRRVGPVEHFRRWCKRNPVVAGLITLAATLTVLVAVVSTVAAYRNGRLAGQLKAQRDEANKNLIQAHTSEAEARRQSHRAGQRFETLGAIERAMQLAPKVGITQAERFRLRNEAIAAMALPDLRVAKELDAPRAKANGFAVDPAAGRYAFRRDDGTVIVRRLADDVELLRLPGLPPAREHSLAGFSPDGRYLAMTGAGNGRLQVWDLERPRLVIDGLPVNPSSTRCWVFHPNSQEVAATRPDGTLVFHELPGGGEVRHLTRGGGSYGTNPHTLDLDATGTRLAVGFWAGPEHKVMVIAADDGRVLAELAQPAPAFHLAWNPRRPNLLALACEDGVIYVRDVETGQQTAALKGESGQGIVIAYHPDGELLASRGWHCVLRLWDTRTGRTLLSQPSAWSSTLEFDRTGRWLSTDATQEKARILEVADAAESRTLVREPFRDDAFLGALAIDPTGRRVVTTGASVTVWDLPTGSTLATLPVTGNTHRVLFDASGAVLTSLPALLRWPVTEAPGGVTTVGPPQVLQPRGTRDAFAITPDGRTVAAAMYNEGGLVVDVQNPERTRWLSPHRDVRYIAVSPDGRWVVTGSHWYGEGMKLWDAQIGQLVHDFPGVSDPDNKAVGSFSADGRWLAVNWDGWVLFETTTWTLKVRLFRGVSSGLAFAPDSRTAVYDNSAGVLNLVEVETGRELARFEDPEQARSYAVAFTPDGSQLVTSLTAHAYLRVWDLRAIRRRLARMGLDWGPPASFGSPDPTGAFSPMPKPFRIDGGQLESSQRQQAQDALKRAGESPQADARQLNNLAWELATGPTGMRDPERALELARRAVAQAPAAAVYLNTLGVAQYRAGQYVESVATLEKSLAAGRGASDAFDLFFLAMARHRLGEAARARAEFDRAVQWRRDHPEQPDHHRTELDAFQAEARALLNGPSPELPAEVFAPKRPGRP